MTTQDDHEIRKVQFRIASEEAEWQERWHPLNPAPRNNPDIRPVVLSMDEQLLQACQILSLGPGIVSPLSVQHLKNRLALYDAEIDLRDGKITPEDYDEMCHLLLDNEVEDTKAQVEREH